MDIPVTKKKITKSKIIIAVWLFILTLFIVFLVSSFGGKSKLNIDSEKILVSAVKEGTFQENIPVNGIVLPITTIYLDALEGGRVEEIFVEDGAVIKQNEPILRLSNTDLELSLVNQETSLYNLLTQIRISQNAARQNTINKLTLKTDVENELIEADRKYKLSKELYSQKAIGRHEFQETENNYNYQKQRMALALQVLQQDSISTIQEAEQSKISHIQTQIALDLIRRKGGDLIVRAPVDGQLTSLDAQIGQSINKGERLGQLDVLSGFKVRADIDEHYISRIYAGQSGSFTFNGNDYSVLIKKVFTQVTNGKFQVDMHFEADIPDGIRRGQSLKIRLALSNEKSAVLIPKGSFFQKTGGNWIFKLSDDGKIASKVDLQLGNQNIEYYEVISGLKPGDKIITSSYENYGDKHELILN
jgi:HlyD family secretion protein